MRPLLQRILERPPLPAETITQRTDQIHLAVMRQSRYMDGGNFRAIHTHDLQRMFELYDELFFEKQIRERLADTCLRFNLSRRMTSTGATTEHVTPTADMMNFPPFFVITISTTLMFESFQGEHRPIVVTGLTCRDRLEALQRLFEHELVHLMEMLLWDDSSCSASRFQTIAHHVFGHTDHRHELMTPRERALTQFNIRVGDRVRFRFDGAEHRGYVNRITRRATVLVEDPHGEPYTDGKRYRRYYVPLPMLTRDGGTTD